jgi:hypothetical protein
LYRQALTRGIVGDRRWLLAVTTTSGARRLSIDRNDVMPGFDQAGEGWHGKLGRAHESEAQAHASVFLGQCLDWRILLSPRTFNKAPHPARAEALADLSRKRERKKPLARDSGEREEPVAPATGG